MVAHKHVYSFLKLALKLHTATKERRKEKVVGKVRTRRTTRKARTLKKKMSASDKKREGQMKGGDEKGSRERGRGRSTRTALPLKS